MGQAEGSDSQAGVAEELTACLFAHEQLFGDRSGRGFLSWGTIRSFPGDEFVEIDKHAADGSPRRRLHSTHPLRVAGPGRPKTAAALDWENRFPLVREELSQCSQFLGRRFP
ncbi:MAG: hypothetical protein Ct9H300mP1_00230 [Planctomycetaceae bacterium]|nr:MAG: hypothetical protein Ct9H300mP1_00230 [Planctomycetaceae bacterium]